MILHFIHSGFLWLIVPLAVFILIAARSGGGLNRLKIFLAGIALLCLSGVLIALAEPYTAAVQNKTNVFLADVSNSISDADLEYVTGRIKEISGTIRDGSKIKIVCFASYPIELPDASVKDGRWDLAEMRKTKKDIFSKVSSDYYDQTDIAAAMLFAQMLIKQDGNIYVFTDGLETRGQAEKTAGEIARQNIRFQFETVGHPLANEVILSDVIIPKQVRQGQNASVQVLLDSSAETPVQIEMLNSATGANQRFNYDIKQGENIVRLPIDTSSSPAVSYKITVFADADTVKNNNSRQVTIPIIQKPAVYVIAAKDESAIFNTILNWLGDSATVERFTDAANLDSADLLIVTDADAGIMTEELTGRIRKAVNSGMGLIVFPGQHLIRERLLSDGPLAEMLPVNVYQYGKKTNPDTTVVFIIDTSGSMTGSRIAVAREIARQSIGRLSPYDKVGIVEFYGNRRWAAPIQSAANQLDIYRALNRLTAGGGTVIMPAMEEAYYALLNVNTTTKHIVVISDGGFENADFEALLRKMADSRISVSTVLVGPGTHTGFMAELSQWGQGTFFHAEERFILPDLNFKTVFDKTGSPFQHNTDLLRAQYPSSLLAGVSIDKVRSDWEYLPCQLKSAGQAVLEFSNGKPFAAVWNYSLGSVVFFSADVFGQGSRQQNNDTDFPNLIANLSRRMYRPWSRQWDMQYAQKNNTSEIEIHRQLEDEQEKTQLPSLIVRSEDSGELKLPVLYSGRQTYTAAADDLPRGNYTAVLKDESGNILMRGGFSVNAVAEIKAVRPDSALIERLGNFSGNPAASSEQKHTAAFELWPYFMLSGLILFLLHILIRRLGVLSRRGLIIWIGVLMLQCHTAFAAENIINGGSHAAIQMDSATHRPVFSDMAGMFDGNSADLPALAMLCGDYNGVEGQFEKKPEGNFADAMLRGFCLYKLNRYADAYEVFNHAGQLTKSENDRKYALAWTLRMAEKSQKLNSLETQLLNSQPFLKYHCRTLELLYSLKNNLSGLEQLREKIETPPGFDRTDKTRIEQQIINLSINSDSNNAALKQWGGAGGSNVALLLGQVRAKLIGGERTMAGQMLESMISDTNLSGEWLFIAQNAANMAFYEIADKAASQVMNLPDVRQKYTAGIFRVTLAMSGSRQSEAIEMLNQLQTLAGLDEHQEYEIARYYEKMGQFSRAIEQYQQVYSRTGASDVQMRIAWLYEKNNEFDKAYQAWFALWSDSNQPSLLFQIQPRLLEIASRTGKLAELAVRLEESLEKSGLDFKTLELLVDLYVSAGDSASAVELVRKYLGNTDMVSLDHQYRIYLRCHEYGRCRRVLHRMINKDPEHRGEYFRQLALLAVEKGDEKDALNVIRSIKNLQDANSMDLEYIAGIWDLLDRPELAMEAYGQLLKQDNSVAENWLLWSNAAQKAGHRDEAVRTLSGLLTDNTSDDLFTVAVDSLLNLEADQMYLENALISIYGRIAKAPNKVFLYRLAADVLAETAGFSDYSEVLLSASIYSPDGRATLLQEIQRATGRTDASLDYGMILVYMDTQLPPQAGIELGKAFLERGDYETAQFLFHRTQFLFEDSDLCLNIADGFERAGMFDQAAMLVREAIAVMPDNVQLLNRLASYDEIQGDFPNALKGYMKAYQLSVNSLSESYGREKQDKENSGRNVQTEERSRQTALYGLLATMTGETQINETLEYFENSLAPLLTTGENLSFNKTKLLQMWKDYEQLCLATGNTARANRILKQVANRFADKPDAIIEVIQNRIFAGDFLTAVELAGTIDVSLLPEDIKRQLRNPREKSVIKAMSDEELSRSLMNAVLAGDSKNALHQIDEMLTRQDDPQGKLYSAELTAAVLLENHDYLKRIIAGRISALSKESSEKRLPAVRTLLSGIWAILSEPEKRWLASQITAACSKDTDILHLLEVSMIHCRLQKYYAAELAYRFSQAGNKSVERLAEILLYSDPNRRNDVVKRALDSIPAQRRRQFLLELAGQIRFDLTDAQRKYLIKLFETQPPIKLPPKGQYAIVSRYEGRNVTARLLLLDMAEIMLSDMPDNLAVNVFAAKSRFLAGKEKQAVSLAGNTIDILTGAAEINYEYAAILRDTIRVLSPDNIKNILSDLTNTMEVTGPSPQLYFITAELNEVLGNHQQARTLMGKCFQHLSDNTTVLHELISWYDSAGRREELANILASNMRNPGLSELFQERTLLRLYYQAGRKKLMFEAAAKDTTPLHNMNYLALYRNTGDISNLVRYFRKMLTDCRREGRFFAPTWLDWDSPEGITGWEYSQANASNRRNIYQVLGGEPAIAADFARYWQAITPYQNDFEKFAQGYAPVLFVNGRAEQTIADILKKSSEQKLSRKDYVLALYLTQQQTVAAKPVNPELLEKLRAQTDISDTKSLRIIADAYLAKDRKPQSLQYYRWITTYQWVTVPNSEMVFDDANSWFEADGSKESRKNLFFMQWLTADLPDTDNPQYESAKSKFLARWGDSQSYESRMSRIEQITADCGRDSDANPLSLDLLRYALAADKQELFTKYFDEVLEIEAKTGRAGWVVDYQKLISAGLPDERIGKYLNIIQTRIIALQEKCVLSDDEVVRNLSLLAAVLYEKQYKPQAEAILVKIGDYQKEPSLSSLWFSDALRICGHTQQAEEIEQTLVKNGIIPKSRSITERKNKNITGKEKL